MNSIVRAFLFSVLALASLPVGAFAQDEDEGGPGPRRIDMPPEDEGGTSAEEPVAEDVETTVAEEEHVGPPARVYVVSVATDGTLVAVASRAGAAARASLRELDDVAWAEADQLFLGYDDNALETIARARQRLSEGRDAYLNLDLDRAIELLNGAVEDFDHSAGAVESPIDLGEALLLLGASLAFNGRTRDATRVFTRLHVQMPHITPDPNVFPPDVIERFDAARPRDAGAPSASITIESDPPGAIAYVDFVARGVTPITVEGLIGGDHIVRVSRPGATSFVQPITVRAHQSTTTSAFLVDDPRAGTLADTLLRVVDDDMSELSETAALREVATTLELDRVGVIRASPGDSPTDVALELVVFDVASGRRLVRGAGHASTALGELEPQVDRLVAGALEAAAHARVEPVAVPVDEEEIPDHPVEPPPPPAGTPVYEEWWFWTVIGGVAVAGIAVGIGVGVGTQGPGIGQHGDAQVVIEF